VTDAPPHDTDSGGYSLSRILLIGYDELTEVTERALHAAGAHVTHLRNPTDRELRRALAGNIDSVAVLSKDDHVSLRLALIIENARPGMPLVVTVFGKIVATQLQRAVPNARVVSMAQLVVPSLAGPCFHEDLLSVSRRPEGLMGVRLRDDEPELVPIEPHRTPLLQRLLANLGALLDPFELSARILLTGLLGFLFILALDTTVLSVGLGEPIVEAFYAATKTIVTVGPNPIVDHGDRWLKIFSSVCMLAGLGFTAIFTAGVVDRLLSRRLAAIVGRRAVPRRNHVVVVGLGQVGLRLCLFLRELGVPVLAVEVNPESYHVNRAKDYGIPVVIGRGGSRFLLRRLSLRHARALAAVTSDEVENISIVVAASGMREDLRTILRAGRGEVVNETRSLFKIGVVRDVYRIGGTLMAAAALGSDVDDGFLHGKTVYLIHPDGRLEPFQGDIEAVLARDESQAMDFGGATIVPGQ
jgi:hypothetical protein